MAGNTEPGRAAVAVCVTPVINTSGPQDLVRLGVAEPDGTPAAVGARLSILNPGDEAAVRAAVKLGGERDGVVAVHVGGRAGEAALRDALAAGAGQAVRLQPPDKTVDAQIVAEAVAAFLRFSPPRWVLCGQATLDWANALVPPMLAELLGWALVDQILEIEPEDAGAAQCVRRIGRGVREVVRVRPPAVLAVSAFAFQPSSPPLRERLRAQRTAIDVRQATVDGCLPRAMDWHVSGPRPRPKAALPSDYTDWSPEDRLRFLTEPARTPARSNTRWLRGDSREIAREILDFVEEYEARVKWSGN